jgi:hypothetical protein
VFHTNTERNKILNTYTGIVHYRYLEYEVGGDEVRTGKNGGAL